MATALPSSAFKAAVVCGELTPEMTAVCTTKPVRFTCSRNSWSRPERSAAACVAVASADDESDDDDGMSLIDEDGCACGELVAPDDPPQAVAPRPITSRAAAVLAARGRDSMKFLQNGSGFTHRSTAEPDLDRQIAGLIRFVGCRELS